MLCKREIVVDGRVALSHIINVPDNMVELLPYQEKLSVTSVNGMGYVNTTAKPDGPLQVPVGSKVYLRVIPMEVLVDTPVQLCYTDIISWCYWSAVAGALLTAVIL